MSKQATCGRSGRSLATISIGFRLCGWCSGASGLSLPSAATTSGVDPHGLRVVDAAMHHPVADGDELVSPRRWRAGSRPGGRSRRRGRAACPRPRSSRRAPRRLRSLATNRGAVSMPSIWPLSMQRQLLAGDVEDAELEARRAGVEDQDDVGHGVTPRPCRPRAAPWRRAPRRRRRRAGVTSESARLVRMIGTRAPRTMPAASAPARKVRLLASMLPASRSGTSSTLARPGHRRIDLLDARRFGIDGVVERQRAVDQRAGDLMAVHHLAQRRRLDGRRHLRS